MTEDAQGKMLERIKALEERFASLEQEQENSAVADILSLFASLSPRAKALTLQCLDVRHRTDAPDDSSLH
jgi:hypothetical protein